MFPYTSSHCSAGDGKNANKKPAPRAVLHDARLYTPLPRRLWPIRHVEKMKLTDPLSEIIASLAVKELKKLSSHCSEYVLLNLSLCLLRGEKRTRRRELKYAAHPVLWGLI
jgi:hypothetical protein